MKAAWLHPWELNYLLPIYCYVPSKNTCFKPAVAYGKQKWLGIIKCPDYVFHTLEFITRQSVSCRIHSALFVRRSKRIVGDMVCIAIYKSCSSFVVPSRVFQFCMFIMSAMAFQITGVSNVCSTVGPGAGKKHPSKPFKPNSQLVAVGHTCFRTTEPTVTVVPDYGHGCVRTTNTRNHDTVRAMSVHMLPKWHMNVS